MFKLSTPDEWTDTPKVYESWHGHMCVQITRFPFGDEREDEMVVWDYSTSPCTMVSESKIRKPVRGECDWEWAIGASTAKGQ